MLLLFFALPESYSTNAAKTPLIPILNNVIEDSSDPEFHQKALEVETEIANLEAEIFKKLRNLS